jgi:hypothetical protein
MWKLLTFYTSISKNYDECKLQLMSNEFNIFKVNDLIHVHFDSWKMWKKHLLNMFKYKHEVLNYCVCFNIY